METIVLFLLTWSVYSINVYFYKKEAYKKIILANSLISLTIVLVNTLGNFENASHMGIFSLVVTVLISTILATFFLCLPIAFKMNKHIL
ncbi:hypothetical protein [Enterococcus pallens]|uniref:Uncharacterized protein n=1 Tax=Enterococcus pallens ATCC BAA-351 TaxID=1158607 RepID=R2SFY2_9ENTE|nr:hypothetical protein [Enterococcus pallens]EOH91801.1 hypothetical protein UAU_03103 [Enterococcus pallens ATCC BAA-351]EOU25229.1 hypothetical protein I588_01217 [Enterococcus pallens ATCC BAA-351]OJG79972.1 hypothetical protein RV10_GL005042 [Enterococcus pallens]